MSLTLPNQSRVRERQEEIGELSEPVNWIPEPEFTPDPDKLWPPETRQVIGRHREMSARHYRWAFHLPPRSRANGPWWSGPAILAATLLFVVVLSGIHALVF